MLWKPVPGFEEYEVSEHGDLRHGKKILSPERVSGNGGIDRKRFTLTKGDRLYRFYAARLVALAFLGPKPSDDAELCHNDGFEHNNHFSNLRWDSRASNIADQVYHKFVRKHRSQPYRFSKSKVDRERLSAMTSRFLADNASK